MIVSCRELTKIYRDAGPEYPALKGVSFDIKEGEFVAVMGASGCGKSTLLNILGLMDVPTAGEYNLCGENVSRFNDSQRTAMRRKTIGFVFQSFNLLPRISAYDNVCLPMRYAGAPRDEMEVRSRELLAKVGLSAFAHKTPLQLSGGQRQRVSIARALANNPSLILADEPTGNLDSKSSEEVISFLASLNKDGMSIIMVTHDAKIAALAHRRIVMRDGLIEEPANAT